MLSMVICIQNVSIHAHAEWAKEIYSWFAKMLITLPNCTEINGDGNWETQYIYFAHQPRLLVSISGDSAGIFFLKGPINGQVNL